MSRIQASAQSLSRSVTLIEEKLLDRSRRHIKQGGGKTSQLRLDETLALKLAVMSRETEDMHRAGTCVIGNKPEPPRSLVIVELQRSPHRTLKSPYEHLEHRSIA